MFMIFYRTILILFSESLRQDLFVITTFLDSATNVETVQPLALSFFLFSQMVVISSLQGIPARVKINMPVFILVPFGEPNVGAN